MLYIVVETSLNQGEYELNSVARFRKNSTMNEFYDWTENDKIDLLENGHTVIAETTGCSGTNSRVSRYTMQHTLPAEKMAAATKEFTIYVETENGMISVLPVTPEAVK